MLRGFAGVAGANAPAFVERSNYGHIRLHAPDSDSVAGANAPAFVERNWSAPACILGPVSPELTLRPSLSDGLQRDPSVGPETCRRS